MTIFSLHLAQTGVATTAGALLDPAHGGQHPGPAPRRVHGVMTLGSPIISPARMQLNRLAVFASWESERDIDAFLADTALGRRLAKGWHVRMAFLRRWGRVAEFSDLPPSAPELDPTAPVVAVTLARLKLTELARFIRWGKPVEELVRDHPGATLALAGIRPPHTFGTFSVWQSQRAMTDMVRGHGSTPGAERHAAAMVERKRQDFHYEFTTLRFRALSEHGEWEGRSEIVPRSSTT